MIDDQPASTAIPVDKAEPRWTSDFFAVADLRKSVRPRADSDVTIDANTLFTQDSLVGWRHGVQYVEVLPNRPRGVTKRGRPGAPPQRRAPSVSLSGTFPRIPSRYILPACWPSAASGAARTPTVMPEMNARRSIIRSPDPPAAGATAGSSGPRALCFAHPPPPSLTSVTREDGNEAIGIRAPEVREPPDREQIAHDRRLASHF